MDLLAVVQAILDLVRRSKGDPDELEVLVEHQLYLVHILEENQLGAELSLFSFEDAQVSRFFQVRGRRDALHRRVLLAAYCQLLIQRLSW